MAQTREELEKQRVQLRKEIEETEKQLNSNKQQTKEGLLQWKLISNKVDLQDRVVNNINKELKILDNNIYGIQRDINRYNKLLDTLKDEYAKSMVYAYKNRGNYDFLNFIFSASSFNDAIKRVAYLKSYRNYQEIQGQNIIRTQELRQKKIEDLGGSKKEKNTSLQSKAKELAILESEQKEKDRIVAKLKLQGKSLNSQIAAKKKQMTKVNNAITAAIKKAQEDARKAAIAKAKEDERKRVEKEKLTTKAPPSVKDGGDNKPVKVKETTTAPIKKLAPENVLLNTDAKIALNVKFEQNRGSLPWPVDKGNVLMHYGPNKLPSGSDVVNTAVTISAEIGAPVKAVFAGLVSNVLPIDGMEVVIIQHGKYFTTYSNLSGVGVKAGQEVITGQTLGRVAPNLEGIGTVDFFMSDERSSFDPEKWLRRK
ncbi:MAG: peptidoglycan DD-metalloendopeptidase family protein [Ferruginibacter sp.]